MGQVMTVEQRVASLASIEPDRPALVFVPPRAEASILTYRVLDYRVNHCARALAAAGVVESDTIVVALAGARPAGGG